MKKLITLVSIVIVVYFTLFCNAQTLPRPLPVVAHGWERIYIKDVGSFDLPPIMEVQNEKYFVDTVSKMKYYDTPKLTTQAKCSNDDNEILEKYARIIVKTIMGAPNDYSKLDFNEYTQADISELNNIFKQQILLGVNKIGIKVIEWYPIKIETINGMTCMHISYKYEQQNALFLMHDYYFQNYDRMHSITFAYRLSEENYFESDFIKVLNSFRITNIKK
jgi:hypothetical protein